MPIKEINKGMIMSIRHWLYEANKEEIKEVISWNNIYIHRYFLKELNGKDGKVSKKILKNLHDTVIFLLSRYYYFDDYISLYVSFEELERTERAIKYCLENKSDYYYSSTTTQQEKRWTKTN